MDCQICRPSFGLQPAFIPLPQSTHLVSPYISFSVLGRGGIAPSIPLYLSLLPSHTHYIMSPSPFHPPFSMLLETRRLISSRSTGGSVTHSSTRYAMLLGAEANHQMGAAFMGLHCCIRSVGVVETWLVGWWT